MNKFEIVIGSDHAGYDLKQKVKEYLSQQGFKIIDVGCDSTESCDYPVFGELVAQKTIERDCYGVAICGSGIGISIACNKVKGARCANVNNSQQVKLARKHNDINIVAFGARLLKEDKVFKLLDLFLNTKFDGGRHQRRINRLNKM